jgi:dTMP kinase
VTKLNDLEQLLKKELSGYRLSPSHDLLHSFLVLHYAQQLQEIHGGDLDIITAAALLHDLGRVDANLPDDKSIERSCELAENMLTEIEFPKRKIKQTLEAIEDHDKPDFHPRTIEGRILKDSDFLAGFGAWGILRTAMWSGETGDGLSQFYDLINEQMPLRIQGLEFRESEIHAQKETIFVKYFIELLNERPLLKQKHPGKYIVFEGNSGVGKNTQAGLLKKHFDEMGLRSIQVDEPTKIFKGLDAFWEDKYGSQIMDDKSMFRLFLITADRAKQINDVVSPSLEKGTHVISVRSYISMLIYQCTTKLERLFVTLVHGFVPSPDLVILYDLDPNTCYERVRGRNQKIQAFDKLASLTKYRPLYLDVPNVDFLGFPIEIIDASGTIEEIEDITWKTIQNYLAI